MRPNLWRWVGIGMLLALGVAWLTEVWLTTRAPWRPWTDSPPSAMVSPARKGPPPRIARPSPARGASTGGSVIVEHSDGTADQVSVGQGQTVIVGTDGSIHIVSGAGPATIEKRRGQAAIQSQEAAMQAKMAAAQQDMEAARQKAMAMGQGAVRIDKGAPAGATIFYRPVPAPPSPDGSNQAPQPSNADGAGGTVSVAGDPVGKP